LRQSITYVPQDIALFDDTLLYNITFSNPSATLQQIEDAITFACVEDLIKKLPNGYQTQVGKNGFKLSGGERQRIILARTFLRESSIYIFDEATSSLDPVTEQNVLKNIFSLRQKAAVFIIAHRMDTVTKADEIILLNQGRIVMQGSHQYLLQHSNLYVDLWKSSVHRGL